MDHGHKWKLILHRVFAAEDSILLQFVYFFFLTVNTLRINLFYSLSSILTIVRRVIRVRIPFVNFWVPRWDAENVAMEGNENEEGELDARQDHGELV